MLAMGAVSGQRCSGSGQRRDPVSGVVLVIAVVLLGAGRALTRLGRRCLRRSASVVRSLPQSFISKYSDVLWSIRDYKPPNQLAECKIVRMLIT
jgi:alpha-D-ribose 1-methylphosphonate 5-triphosphate synthase subunit PhnH